jgi:hypothetical protein
MLKLNKNSVFIIHFQPIELYPPALNILQILAQESKFTNIILVSFKSPYVHKIDKHEQIRYVRVSQFGKNKWSRLLSYVIFYLKTIQYLITQRPSKVIYFESISSIPAILYKFFFRKSRIFVHYHEYTSPLEYRQGMLVNRISYRLEKWYYHKFEWISHTNEDRIRLFLNDVQINPDEKINEMPNYPPKSWMNLAKCESKLNAHKTKFIYIGALSFEDTYLKEIIDYVVASDKFELELYAFTIPNNIQNYINSLANNRIYYSGRLEYGEIPKALKGKEIGLVLYKGNTLNFTYNAPNKLFEYLVCGLDVWYPKEMIGCAEIQKANPDRVYEMDFTELGSSEYYFQRPHTLVEPIEYIADQSTKKLLKKLAVDV